MFRKTVKICPVVLLCIGVNYLSNAWPDSDQHEVAEVEIFSKMNFTGFSIIYGSTFEKCLDINCNVNLTEMADVRNSARLVHGRCVLFCSNACNDSVQTSGICQELKAVNGSSGRIHATTHFVRSLRSCPEDED